jgi:hypothetical protein
MIAYGTNRARAVDEAFAGSTGSRSRDPARLFLAGTGVILGLATAILILFN